MPGVDRRGSLLGVAAHDRQVFRYRLDFGGGERDVVSLLEPDWVYQHGLHPEAVLGVVRDGADSVVLAPVDLGENGAFLRLLSRVIFEHIADCGDLRHSPGAASPASLRDKPIWPAIQFRHPGGDERWRREPCVREIGPVHRITVALMDLCQHPHTVTEVAISPLPDTRGYVRAGHVLALHCGMETQPKARNQRLSLGVPDTWRRMIGMKGPSSTRLMCRGDGGPDRRQWLAHSILAVTPWDQDERLVVPLTGFSWGYSVGEDGAVSLVPVSRLTGTQWRADVGYLGATYPGWIFGDGSTLEE
jgi:hypothetical protein